MCVCVCVCVRVCVCVCVLISEMILSNIYHLLYSDNFFHRSCFIQNG